MMLLTSFHLRFLASSLMYCVCHRCVQTVFKTCHLVVMATASAPQRNISMTATCVLVPIQHSQMRRRKFRRLDFPVCTLSVFFYFAVLSIFRQLWMLQCEQLVISVHMLMMWHGSDHPVCAFYVAVMSSSWAVCDCN